MAEVRCLTADEVAALHDEAVARCGDPASPLVAPDRLQSTLARPRQAAWYEGADLIRQAVLLAVGLSQAQAFLDGNKRAAFAALDVFLRVNGLEYVGASLPLAKGIVAVAEAAREERAARADAFEAWLRGFVGPVPDDD